MPLEHEHKIDHHHFYYKRILYAMPYASIFYNAVHGNHSIGQIDMFYEWMNDSMHEWMNEIWNGLVAWVEFQSFMNTLK